MDEDEDRGLQPRGRGRDAPDTDHGLVVVQDTLVGHLQKQRQ